MGYVDRYKRRSIRLKGYDYTRIGAYFVTLCTRDRACIFGTVVDGNVQLNDCGREIVNCWLWLAEQYPYVRLDEWVVMPNHVHAIVVIMDEHRGGAGVVGQPMVGMDGSGIVLTRRKPLGRLIGAFKTVSTRRINDIRSTPGAKLWQRNYYEHIVRDDPSLRLIRHYIASNPRRWELDHEKLI